MEIYHGALFYYTNTEKDISLDLSGKLVNKSNQDDAFELFVRKRVLEGKDFFEINGRDESCAGVLIKNFTATPQNKQPDYIGCLELARGGVIDLAAWLTTNKAKNMEYLSLKGRRKWGKHFYINLAKILYETHSDKDTSDNFDVFMENF